MTTSPPDDDRTFLFADLAGYTALTEAHGDEHAAETAAAFYDEVRSLLPPYEAVEIKAIGDALMLLVPEPDRAIALGTRIICEVGVRERALGVRVGMHTGRAVQRGGDWFGAAVNVASRVAGEARGGEILVTSATFEAAQARGCDVPFRRHGSHRLKNVASSVEVYAVDLSEHNHPKFAHDPVCQMAMDPARSEERVAFGGVTYHFCSPECAQAFRADPRSYVADAPRRSGWRISRLRRRR